MKEKSKIIEWLTNIIERILFFNGPCHNLKQVLMLWSGITVLLAAGCINNMPDDTEETASPGQVTLAGVSETSFNPLDSAIRFEIAGAVFSTDPSNVLMLHNGVVVPDSSIDISADAIVFQSFLDEGRNDFQLYAADAQGLSLYKAVTLWAGNYTLNATILNEDDQQVSGVVVTAALGDDHRVIAEATSVDGQVSFQNLPDRTIIFSAVTSDNRLASLAATGGEGSVELRLIGFDAVNPIDNNDLSLGTTDGWNIGDAPVELIPHVEPSSNISSTRAMIQDTEDLDLVLNTSGEGPQSISRTFEVKSGTKHINVRYRFITSEVPGGYFGTEFNDSFSVSIRSQKGGSSVSESNSMNGLGLSPFDESGATDWREASLSLNEDGDTIQVDITVTNVSDDKLDSQIIIDKIEEKKLAITKLDLKDIDNNALNYLSADEHTYFSSNTRIHGTITVEGDKEDELESLELEVIQGGSAVATAQLANDAEGMLLKSFGDAEKVEITQSQLLFELPSSEAGSVDGSTNGTVSLRVKAKSRKGEETTKEFDGAAEILVRYSNDNRYGGRDETVGGDDWLKPGVKEVIEHYTITVGDISNMNGGSFPPHGSHQTGNDADGWFEGYNNRDAATAATIIGHLNDPTYGSRIQFVGATHERTDGNPFWEAIKDVTLDDGRQAPDVIRPWAGHTTHFHWRISD